MTSLHARKISRIIRGTHGIVVRNCVLLMCVTHSGRKSTRSKLFRHHPQLPTEQVWHQLPPRMCFKNIVIKVVFADQWSILILINHSNKCLCFDEMWDKPLQVTRNNEFWILTRPIKSSYNPDVQCRFWIKTSIVCVLVTEQPELILFFAMSSESNQTNIPSVVLKIHVCWCYSSIISDRSNTK